MRILLFKTESSWVILNETYAHNAIYIKKNTEKRELIKTINLP
jgi:hypothetical protein